MNRKLLALAVGAALTLPLAAQAAPTIYGQLNMSVDKVSTTEPGGDDEWQVNSNSSRLGVMGEEALGSGLSAVYKIEYGVAGDVAGTNDLKGRDRYLGLKGDFGTVKLGAFDSPLKQSQGMVDQFNDMTYTDMGNFITGENRMNNLIGYESPKIADAITAKVVIQPGEDTAGDNNSLADGVSASVAYEAGGFYAALGADKNVSDGSFNATTNRDALRLTGTYTMGDLQLGALVQSSERSDGPVDNKQMAWLLSAALTMGDNVLKGQLIMSTTEDLGPEDQKVSGLALGVDHNFTKQTKVYGQAGYAKVDSLNGGNTDSDNSVITVGMLTRF